MFSVRAVGRKNGGSVRGGGVLAVVVEVMVAGVVVMNNIIAC